MNVTRRIALSAVCLIPLVGLVLLAWRGLQEVPQISFNVVAWQRADQIENHRTVRSQMVEDLLVRHRFEGWTRDQVLTLLGTPATGAPSDLGFPQWDIVYVLGLERNGSFSLDYEALGFQFDAADRVVKVGLSVN